MKRWERPLLLFSLAMNVAFVSLAATHIGSRSERPDRPEPVVILRDGPHGVTVLERGHARRRAALDRELRLDPEQDVAFDAGFRRVRPLLRDARRVVLTERLGYVQALEQGDVGTARDAARRLSHAQVRVDSLVAEAMLHETSLLSPDQRARYVLYTFRPGSGKRRSMLLPHHFEERTHP